MPTVAKIKIYDIPELRKQLDTLYDKSSQKEIAKWALKLAKHILEQYAPSYETDKTILKGYSINECWQKGIMIKMYDLRQVGFSIHRLAKEQESNIICMALRVVGQAVGTAHMKEHGMVASDYAIKCFNIAYPNNKDKVEQERLWQINELRKICSETDKRDL